MNKISFISKVQSCWGSGGGGYECDGVGEGSLLVLDISLSLQIHSKLISKILGLVFPHVPSVPSMVQFSYGVLGGSGALGGPDPTPAPAP